MMFIECFVKVRCNYLMPNTTVENNFQLGVTLTLKLTPATLPYMTSHVIISVVCKGQYGSSSLHVHLFSGRPKHQHEDYRPKGSFLLILFKLCTFFGILIIELKITISSVTFFNFKGWRRAHCKSGRPTCA